MDTRIALLTPPGKAAIATISLHGPDAWTMLRAAFVPRQGTLPEEPVTGHFWFGRLHDDVILAVKSADRFELHCHGGPEVVRLLQEQFTSQGARIVAWTDETDPLTVLLSRAPTARTAAILLDQRNGAWDVLLPSPHRGRGAGGEGGSIPGMDIIEGASALTPNPSPSGRGEPDFLPSPHRGRGAGGEGAAPPPNQSALARLRALIPLGQHLVEPWTLVLAGAPNVGKSSLMNALAGYTRSIVAPTPGTTRDLVRLRTAIDGWPVELIDTAGLREADASLEAKGIELARAALAQADLRLWVLDGANSPVLPLEGEDWLMVINKVDAPPAWDWSSLPKALRISALAGTGMAELCAAISARLVPAPPLAGEPVPCLSEHMAMIEGTGIASQ